LSLLSFSLSRTVTSVLAEPWPFLPSFLSFLCLRHYFLTLQIFKSPEFFCIRLQKEMSGYPHNTVHRHRERISRLLQIQTKQTALGDDHRLCIRICYQRTNW
jgi:hypothetical protein